uniref:THAP-type domain-containing protein n=1 Tax=Sander lucioperca TaxID=283035 RepID=A0A8D0A6E8_SANLU
MLSTCCVINCKSHSHDRSRIKLKNGISFYRFPAWKNNSTSHVSEVTKRRRMAWIAAVRRPKITFDNTPPHMMVCSKHFHKGKPAYEMLECDPDWAPSLYLSHTEVKATNTDRFKRFRRRATRSQQQQPPSLGTDHTGPETELEAHMNQPPSPGTDHTGPEAELDNAAPLYPDMETETSGDDGAPMGNADEQQKCTMCGLRLKEIIRLQEENRKLKGELSKKALDENFLKDNDSKVKYYTGLPSFSLLMVVLMQIIPSLPKSKTKERKLSHFQMLLLTLMRLRLDLPVEHVAHLFDINRQTASNLFIETINVLHAHLSPLVYWPKRHCIQASMPHQYVEMFGNRVTVIIDCFELFIERAQNLRAKAQTYSNYKSRHTMKYLIGITPQGTISFISKGWGGRASDKQITENCGFLQKLSPGDLVLADRGFDIKESVALVGATLKIPAFTRGHSQLNAKDVEETRKLAHVRIHVERVIGCMRSKFNILNDTIRLGFVVPCEGEDKTLLDKIVVVCCALTNMCPSIVVKPSC